MGQKCQSPERKESLIMPLTCYRRTNYCKINWIKRVIVGEKRNRIGIGSFDCRPCAKSASLNAVPPEAWKVIMREWEWNIRTCLPKDSHSHSGRSTWIITGNENILHVVSEMLPSAVRFPSNRIRSSSISGHNPSISGGPPWKHSSALYRDRLIGWL